MPVNRTSHVNSLTARVRRQSCVEAVGPEAVWAELSGWQATRARAGAMEAVTQTWFDRFQAAKGARNGGGGTASPQPAAGGTERGPGWRSGADPAGAAAWLCEHCRAKNHAARSAQQFAQHCRLCKRKGTPWVCGQCEDTNPVGSPDCRFCGAVRPCAAAAAGSGPVTDLPAAALAPSAGGDSVAVACTPVVAVEELPDEWKGWVAESVRQAAALPLIHARCCLAAPCLSVSPCEPMDDTSTPPLRKPCAASPLLACLSLPTSLSPSLSVSPCVSLARSRSLALSICKNVQCAVRS